MKKFSFILIAFLLIISVIGTTYYIKIQKEPDKEVSVTGAFNSSGAKMVINDLYFFVRVPDNFKDLSSMIKVCDDVFKTLGITEYKKNANSTDYLVKTDLTGTTKDGLEVSAMASIVGDKSRNADKYITVDVTGTDRSNALLLREKIEDVLEIYKLKAEVNSCITGTYEGNLSDSQLEGICREILNDSDAKKVDSQRFQNVISISAFSPLIKDKLSLNGKNINLSLAIRYNKQENRTYLWVATPVVNAEY